MTVSNAIDRVNELATCLDSISDLMIPSADMHIINRDNFAILLNFLLSEQRLALDALDKALREDRNTKVHAHL